jgi:hypothetical protein
MQLSEINKTIINVCTLIVAVGAPVVSALNSQALPPAVGVTIGAIVAIAGAVVHWATPNTTTDPQVAATQSVKLKPAGDVHKVNTPPAAGP